MESSGFREIVRSATVSRPVVYAFALCIAFAALVLGGALVADGLLRWILVAFAASSVFYGFAVFTLAVLRKPELLRSERYQTVQRVIDFIEDSDHGPETMEVSRLMLGATKKVSRSSPKGSRTGGQAE